MKALLVLDMPNSCDECPLNSHTEYDFDVCWVTQGKGGCPLRPAPKKKNECYYYGEIAKNMFAVGYNTCLEEIVGETE